MTRVSSFVTWGFILSNFISSFSFSESITLLITLFNYILFGNASTVDDMKYKEIPFIFFQGREKEVTIFSCVRASKDRSIGFLADYRRMNVGITRAKSSVLVCPDDIKKNKNKNLEVFQSNIC